MATVPHEFVTVDMRDLKAALVAHARERRVSVSVVVRDAVARVLPPERGAPEASRGAVDVDPPTSAVKVSIRLRANEMRRLDSSAKAAGLSRGALICALLEGVDAVSSGGRREQLAALVSSNAALSTLSRNIRHLADLLRRSESRAAHDYREMLVTLGADINGHLMFAGEVLAQMQPTARRKGDNDRGSVPTKETA